MTDWKLFEPLLKPKVKPSDVEVLLTHCPRDFKTKVTRWENFVVFYIGNKAKCNTRHWDWKTPSQDLRDTRLEYFIAVLEAPHFKTLKEKFGVAAWMLSEMLGTVPEIRH